MTANMPTVEQIYDLLNKNHIIAEVYESRNVICIDISWGDWKHDHLRVDHLMEENFIFSDCWEDVTEEDGSDCYSATHRYRF